MITVKEKDNSDKLVPWDVGIEHIHPTKSLPQAKPDLVESLRVHGQLEPILVYQIQDGLAIKDGHNRYAAARELGWDTITVAYVDPPMDDAELLVHQHVINQQRQGVSYLDTARDCQRLVNEFNWKQKKIAADFGMTEADVSLALSTLRAIPAIRQAVDSGRITPSAVEPLLALSPDEQESLFPAALKAKTVRRVRALVEAHKLCRILDDRKAGASAVDDLDPLEVMAIEELDMARKHLESVAVTRITHPDLRQRAGEHAADIRKLAARIASAMAS